MKIPAPQAKKLAINGGRGLRQGGEEVVGVQCPHCPGAVSLKSLRQFERLDAIAVQPWHCAPLLRISFVFMSCGVSTCYKSTKDVKEMNLQKEDSRRDIFWKRASTDQEDPFRSQKNFMFMTPSLTQL